MQPLWMWTRLVLAKGFPHVDTATILVRTTWIAYTAFSFLSVWFVARGTARTAVLPTLLVSGLVPLNWQFQIVVVQGLETSLIMCNAWLDSTNTLDRAGLATLLQLPEIT